MRKKRVLLIISIVILISIPLVVYAHPGSLDDNGGHYNRSTGEYHYHEGLHTSGGSSSSSTEKYTYTTDYTTKRTEYTTNSNITTTNSSDKSNSTSKPIIKKIAIFYIIVSLIAIVALIRYHKEDTDDIKYLNSKIKVLDDTIKEKDNTIQQVVDEANSNINTLIDKNNDAQIKIQQANNIITTITKNNSLSQISKVPPNTKINIVDNSYTIYQKGYDGIYGKYTGYVSTSGNKYHFVKGCSGATIPICLFDKDMIGKRKPCSKCYEPLIDDELLTVPDWFSTYYKLTKYIDNYDKE